MARYVVRQIAKDLVKYLSLDLDPYDLPQDVLHEWMEEKGLPYDDATWPDALTKSQLKDFEAWVIDTGRLHRFVDEAPELAPAYLILMDPQLQPPRTWCIHFTDESPFEWFDRGITLDRLAYSTWAKEKAVPECTRNLTREIGLFEHVWVFAFDAEKRNVLSEGQKYGKNAVLFQTDGAVSAFHIGDQERQLILPACSEYNVIPLYRPEEGNVACLTEDGEERVFESVADVVSYVEEEGKRGVTKLLRSDC